MMRFVPAFRKVTLDPLHDLGDGLSLGRFDDEIDIVIRNTEVQEFKRILLLRLFDGVQELSLRLR